MVRIETRSGSNAIHGSAFEFLQNNVFQARDPFTQGLHAPGKVHHQRTGAVSRAKPRDVPHGGAIELQRRSERHGQAAADEDALHPGGQGDGRNEGAGLQEPKPDERVRLNGGTDGFGRIGGVGGEAASLVGAA